MWIKIHCLLRYLSIQLLHTGNKMRSKIAQNTQQCEEQAHFLTLIHECRLTLIHECWCSQSLSLLCNHCPLDSSSSSHTTSIRNPASCYPTTAQTCNLDHSSETLAHYSLFLECLPHFGAICCTTPLNHNLKIPPSAKPSPAKQISLLSLSSR